MREQQPAVDTEHGIQNIKPRPARSIRIAAADYSYFEQKHTSHSHNIRHAILSKAHHAPDLSIPPAPHCDAQ